MSEEKKEKITREVFIKKVNDLYGSLSGVEKEKYDDFFDIALRDRSFATYELLWKLISSIKYSISSSPLPDFTEEKKDELKYQTPDFTEEVRDKLKIYSRNTYNGQLLQHRFILEGSFEGLSDDISALLQFKLEEKDGQIEILKMDIDALQRLNEDKERFINSLSSRIKELEAENERLKNEKS